MATVLSEIALSHAQGIQRAAKSWLGEHDKAARGRDLEAIIVEVRGIPGHLEQLERWAFEDMQENRIRDYDGYGQDVLQVLDATLAAIKDVAASTGGDEHSVQSELDGIAERVQKCKATFAARWPWIDRQMLAASQQDSDHGRLISAQDLLNGLRN